MSFDRIAIHKNDLDFYLRELSKEFRKLNGRSMPTEIELIGGASVLINYELYGSWGKLPVSSAFFIEQAMEKENYEEAFDEIQNNGVVNRTVLKTFELVQ